MDEIDTIPTATPVVHEIQHEVHVTPAAPAVDSETNQKLASLQDSYSQLTLKLGEISGKLDAMVTKVPVPVSPRLAANEVQEPDNLASELHHSEAVPDAVTLSVDDSPIKKPKEQPQPREKRGLRKHQWQQEKQ